MMVEKNFIQEICQCNKTVENVRNRKAYLFLGHAAHAILYGITELKGYKNLLHFDCQWK